MESTKMKIQKVLLNLAEGRVDDTRLGKWVEFEYAEDCNIYIQSIVFDYYKGIYKSPIGGGCYKIDFQIVFDIGENWNGTMEVSDKDDNFIAYIQNTILFNSGKNRPNHWSPEQYQNYLDWVGMDCEHWQTFWMELENTPQFQIKVTK
jgi:hypothetical protein